MKLIYCPICGDVARLIDKEWRKCACGESGGQYNKDLMTATIGGVARVFGVGNPFFNEMWPYLTDEGKEQMRRKYGYGGDGLSCSWKFNGTDAWWGDYPGEQQLFHILSPDGPLLKVKVERVSSHRGVVAERSFTNKVTIVDKRDYYIGGILRPQPGFVIVPGNPTPSYRGKR